MAIIKCPECQREVSDSAVSCPHCGYGVKRHFDDIVFKEQEKLRQEIKQKRKKEIISFLKAAIPAFVILAGITTALIINHNILSERTTFKNDQEMIEYLTQYTSWKYDSEYIDEWLMFHPSGLGEVMHELGFDEGNKIVMNPKRGKFSLGVQEFIISNTGNIINYKHDDYYMPSYSAPPIESATKALSLEVLSSSLNDGILKAEIKVTNKGKRTYQFIHFETIAYDADGNSIILDDFETVEPYNKESKGTPVPGLSEYSLAPGESGICSVFAHVKPGYNDFTTQIKDYDVWLDPAKLQ